MSKDSDRPMPVAEGPEGEDASAAEVLQHIGKYQVCGMLGRGSAGIVYLGYDPQLQRQVAIKVLRIARTGVGHSDFHPNQQVAKRFLAEAKSTGKLHHQNIIALYEGDVFGPSPFLVMEYIEGQTLDAFIKSGQRFSLEQLIPILVQLADAIDYAHSQGVLHRDIKPANILIDGMQKPYILDFGVAKIHEQISAEDEGVRATSVLGTPAYMSPEQIKNKPLNNQSDLFAFAIVAFQCLCGVRPFDGDTFAAVASSILEKPAKSVGSLRADLSSFVDEVFARALSKDRSGRYESAKQFVNALSLAIKKPNPASGIGVSPANHALVSPGFDKDIETVRSLVTKAATQNSELPAARTLAKGPAKTSLHRRRAASISLSIKEAPSLTLILFFAGLVIGVTSILCYVFWPRRTVLVIAGKELVSSQATQSNQNQIASAVEAGSSIEKEQDISLYLIRRLNAQAENSDSIPELLSQIKERVFLDSSLDVTPLLMHSSFLVKVSALRILIDKKSYSAAPNIIPLLEDSDPLVRGFAAKALGILANREYSEILAQRALNEQVPEVLRAIENAMERIAERG